MNDKDTEGLEITYPIDNQKDKLRHLLKNFCRNINITTKLEPVVKIATKQILHHIFNTQANTFKKKSILHSICIQETYYIVFNATLRVLFEESQSEDYEDIQNYIDALEEDEFIAIEALILREILNMYLKG